MSIITCPACEFLLSSAIEKDQGECHACRAGRLAAKRPERDPVALANTPMTFEEAVRWADDECRAALVWATDGRHSVSDLMWSLNGLIDYYRKAKARAESAERRVAELEAALRLAVKIASEAAAEWDRDNDMRVGKLLLALAGQRKGYRPETDAIHAALEGKKP